MSNYADFSKEDLFEVLGDGDWHLVGEIADHFDCSTPTVRKRLKYLAEDGFSILRGRYGIRLVDREDLDQETIEEIQVMFKWIFGTVASLSSNAYPFKKLLPTIKKMLPKTQAERTYLRKLNTQMNHLIDFQEIDEEVE